MLPCIPCGAHLSDNVWGMQMSPDLHFAIIERDGRLWIKESGTHRAWDNHTIRNGWRDFGLITRQLNSPTGQFLVRLEGITDGGTQACSELLTDPKSLQSILKDVPADGRKRISNWWSEPT